MITASDFCVVAQAGAALRLAALSMSMSMSLVIATGAYAQVIHGGAELDRGVQLIETESGGYLVVGVTRSIGAGGEDMYLVRIGDEGNVLWQRAHGGSGDDAGWSVLERGSGYIVGGFTNSDGAGGFDCSLMATDHEGALVWSKTFGGAKDDRCWSVASVPDGGYVLAGETASSGSGERDCYLIRTDVEGREIWSQTFGGERDDRCFSVAVTNDRGFMIVGQTYSYGSGDRDAWILKTDRQGSLAWSKTHGGESSDVAHSVVAAENGSFLVTGYTTSLAETPDDPMVLAIAPDGSVRWSQVLAMAGHNRAITGAPASGGGACLAGFSIGGDPVARAALVVKLDGSGQRLWSENVAPSVRGESFGYGVIGTADGGCAITGHSTEGSAGGLDVLFAKLDSRGRSTVP